MENISKIEKIFKNSNSALVIPFSIQLETPQLQTLFNLFSKPHNIIEISISGQNFDAAKLKIFFNILKANTGLKRLILASNKICGKESLEILSFGIKMTEIEYLDLSNNKICDDCLEVLGDLIENSKILALSLDGNNFCKGTFSQFLGKNGRISHFSISNNPLTYEVLSDMLGVLMINKSLKSLHIKGVELEGSAPIKENTNGHLSKKEAIILKLAYVLRFSSLSVISIDIDNSLNVQLEELEKTLVKYNSKLVAINSDSIDWKNIKYKGPLFGIGKALKANAWIAQNFIVPKDRQSEIPNDIEDLVLLKSTKPENYDSFFSNFEGDGVADDLKKFAKKNISSALFSIQSSPRSPDHKTEKSLKNYKEPCNFPLAYSAETPQFSIKGMTFSPEYKNYEKLQDITEISSIDFDEKRCTPVKMKQEKHLEEMWNMIKQLELNMSQNITLLNYKIGVAEDKAQSSSQQILELSQKIDQKPTDRAYNGIEDKGVWSAISRIEKFMTNSSKKENIFDKRLVSIEDEIKNSKETFQKLINLIDDQKLYVQNSLKEKATKIDFEILEKNCSKISNKLNFLNSEIENFRKDISRLSFPGKQIEILYSEINKIKEFPKVLDLQKSFNMLREEIYGRFEGFEVKISEIHKKSPKRESFSMTKNKNDISPLGRQIPTLDIPKAVQTSAISLEELRKKVNITERQKKPAENFLPGEAESLVISAIMEKANNSRIQESIKKQANSRSPSPINGFKLRMKNYEADNIPSFQLQETLRQRGINVDSRPALTERRA